jgi:tetratricopeptide (TPR) repeat protein
MQSYDVLSRRLQPLLDIDPLEAVRQAREIELDTPERNNLIGLRAAILVDGGILTHQQDAIEEGVKLFRELHEEFPENLQTAYNLANAIVATIRNPPHDSNWLDFQERTRIARTEARLHFSRVARSQLTAAELRTQALTNLANQLSNSYRLSEAHDARLAALKIDPENGVAAASAAMGLLWLYKQGGLSDLAYTEVQHLAKIAHRNHDKVVHFAGAQAAQKIAEFVRQIDAPLPRSQHTDPFLEWVERERLTLAPAVELVEPTLGKLDWLMLSSIIEDVKSSGEWLPPPVFAMFNVLKSDFILARDLAWRSTVKDSWPKTARYADTLDYAIYGPDVSALILAHRTALDLLDKVAVTANHYFELGLPTEKVYFGRLWRINHGKSPEKRVLLETVEKAIRAGATALYGLTELADDYDSENGILRSQKDLRNASTHRFVVLHDEEKFSYRETPEIARHQRREFDQKVVIALRVARAAIQMLGLAISQNEKRRTAQKDIVVSSMTVPDHGWIRGYE